MLAKPLLPGHGWDQWIYGVPCTQSEVSEFPGLFAVLWLGGEEGDCVCISWTWFADRKVSFFAQH